MVTEAAYCGFDLGLLYLTISGYFNCFSPLLTWRDLQHIVVLTSRVANLVADDWVTNGVGKKGSQSYNTR